MTGRERRSRENEREKRTEVVEALEHPGMRVTTHFSYRPDDAASLGAR
jgi:hypothetical protein